MTAKYFPLKDRDAIIDGKRCLDRAQALDDVVDLVGLLMVRLFSLDNLRSTN